PKNADILLVAALGNVFKNGPDRGIYKSTDGGHSWKKVLFVNDSTGAADLCYHPENPRIVFATSWNMKRNAYQLSSGGPGSGIWRSTDGGDRWTNISTAKGLPKGIWGKTTVSVSPANPERIYAMIENENGGLYRSDDGGQNWQLVNGGRELRQRAWYFSRVLADPSDENIVYVQNVSLHRSNDGGKTFSRMNTQHADHHDMWINNLQPQHLIVANDGGGQISDDGGKHWSTQNNQPTAQFYRLATDQHFPFRIYVAQQDNSTIRIEHRTRGHHIGEENWEATAGGESGHLAADPLDPDIVYGGSYGGYLTRYDHKRKISRNIAVWPDNPIGHGADKLKYRFQWNYPIFFSPHDPKKLYCASNHLHVTTNEGQSWQTISPDLTRNDSTKMQSSGGPITKDNTSVEYYCTIFAAAESPRVAKLLWVGSDDGLIHMSRDGGKNWTNVTPAGLPQWIMINSIEPDPQLDGGCYVAATGYKNGDFAPYIYKTEDYGKSWTKITKGIPAEHFTRVVRADPIRKGLLFAGTEYGVYLSFDDGKNWKAFQLNLPITPVTDLLIREDFLIAATQGRSIWMMDDLGPLRQLADVPPNKKNFSFKPKPAYRMDGGAHPTSTAGVNHPNGVILHMFLDTLLSTDTVQLFCIDRNGDTLTTYSTHPAEGQLAISLKSGSNKLVLQPKMASAKSFDGMVLWWSSLSGPKALPGIYRFIINSPSYQDSGRFEILPDPLYPVSHEEIQKQHQFIRRIRDRVDEAHRSIIQIRDIRNQLNEFVSRTDKTAETDTLFRLKHRIDSMLQHIENELYQTKSKSGQDPINYPIKLTNKLAHLIALYEGGSFPPTDQAEALRNELDEQVLKQLNAFRALQEDELKTFNSLARKLQVDFIRVKDNN
ncbi:MAG TPA: glycosyl hydrolase, partial [Saprospiraceae bacterium]|nr:glycosyl hydrolase [Saprospiraceae bacterium]